MINNVNSLILGYPIDKSMLPERDFMPYGVKEFDPNDKNNFILMNSEKNKADLQETANHLATSNASEDEENKPEVSEKSTPESIASVIAKEGAHRLTGSALLKGNVYLIAATLLGIDFEEDGNAFKYGAESGKMGDFAGDYKDFFKGLDERASKSYWNAAKEGFNLPANVVAIGVANCMQTMGAVLSEVFGEDITAFIGTGVAAAGSVLNAAGDIAGDTVKGTFGMIKNLFTGDWNGIADSAEGIYDGVKDSVINAANSVADVATDGADVLVDAAKETYNTVADGAGYVADFAEDAYDAVADAAGKAYDEVSDFASDVGDFAEDAWDEVEDFFSGIF